MKSSSSHNPFGQFQGPPPNSKLFPDHWLQKTQASDLSINFDAVSRLSCAVVSALQSISCRYPSVSRRLVDLKMHTSALSLARWGFVFSAASAAASNAHIAPRATQAPSTTAAKPEVTAITGCHLHASELLANTSRVSIRLTNIPPDIVSLVRPSTW